MTLSVRLDEKTRRRLSQFARARRLSRSEIVRRAIDAYIAKDGATEGSTVYDRIKDLIGSVNSGRSDLSQQGGEHIRQILLEKKRQGRL